MNLPNKITMFRIVMIPVFIILLMNGYFYWSAAVFVIASLSDALDGHIARKYNLISNFGKIMDPLADKLLVTAALICLVELSEIPAWMVIVILAREFAITALRTVAASEGVVIAAAKSGKLKTITQMVAIISILIKNYPFKMWGIPFDRYALWAAVAMTIISGLDYIIKNKEIFLMDKGEKR